MWKSVAGVISRRGGEGFARLLGGDLPWAVDPVRIGSLEVLVATFWLSCCPSFFHRFFDAIFERLGSIFGANLLPKIHQNRCQIDAKMPSHVDLLF